MSEFGKLIVPSNYTLKRYEKEVKKFEKKNKDKIYLPNMFGKEHMVDKKEVERVNENVLKAKKKALLKAERSKR